jgi:hypothetical protein
VAAQDPRHGRLLDAVARDLAMAGAAERPDVVHCHTWYTHLAGCLARPLTGARLVLTTHSLEPHRPWKVEQLGTAYHASAWIERTAYENADGVVAVSEAMRADVESLYGVRPERVRVVHNGIDPTSTGRARRPTCCAASASTPTCRACCSSGASRGRRGSCTSYAPSATCARGPGVCRWCCAPAPPTRPRSAPR